MGDLARREIPPAGRGRAVKLAQPAGAEDPLSVSGRADGLRSERRSETTNPVRRERRAQSEPSRGARCRRSRERSRSSAASRRRLVSQASMRPARGSGCASPPASPRGRPPRAPPPGHPASQSRGPRALRVRRPASRPSRSRSAHASRRARRLRSRRMRRRSAVSSLPSPSRSKCSKSDRARSRAPLAPVRRRHGWRASAASPGFDGRAHSGQRPPSGGGSSARCAVSVEANRALVRTIARAETSDSKRFFIG